MYTYNSILECSKHTPTQRGVNIAKRNNNIGINTVCWDGMSVQIQLLPETIDFFSYCFRKSINVSL